MHICASPKPQAENYKINININIPTYYWHVAICNLVSVSRDRRRNAARTMDRAARSGTRPAGWSKVHRSMLSAQIKVESRTTYRELALSRGIRTSLGSSSVRAGGTTVIVKGGDELRVYRLCRKSGHSFATATAARQYLALLVSFVRSCDNGGLTYVRVRVHTCMRVLIQKSV